MENVILIFERTRPTLSAVSAAVSAFPEVETQSDQVVICEGGECIFIQPEDQPAPWWFESWPSTHHIAEPRALVIAYRDLRLVKRVVLALAERFSFLVGVAEGPYTSDEFRRLTECDPTWTWQRIQSDFVPTASRRPA